LGLSDVFFELLQAQIPWHRDVLIQGEERASAQQEQAG